LLNELANSVTVLKVFERKVELANLLRKFVEVPWTVGVPGAVTRLLAIGAEAGLSGAIGGLVFFGATLGAGLAIAVWVIPNRVASPALPGSTIDSDEQICLCLAIGVRYYAIHGGEDVPEGWAIYLHGDGSLVSLTRDCHLLALGG